MQHRTTSTQKCRAHTHNMYENCVYMEKEIIAGNAIELRGVGVMVEKVDQENGRKILKMRQREKERHGRKH